MTRGQPPWGSLCHQPSQERRQKGKQKNCQHYTCAGGKGHQHFVPWGRRVRPASGPACSRSFSSSFSSSVMWQYRRSASCICTRSSGFPPYCTPRSGELYCTSGWSHRNSSDQSCRPGGVPRSRFFRATHHNALHQGLAAPQRYGIFQLDVVLAAWVLLYFFFFFGSCRCS